MYGYNPLFIGVAALPVGFLSFCLRFTSYRFNPLLIGAAALPPSSANALLGKHFEFRILPHFLSKGLTGCPEKQPPGAGEQLSN